MGALGARPRSFFGLTAPTSRPGPSAAPGRPASPCASAVHDDLAVDDHVVDPDRELLRLHPRRRRLDRLGVEHDDVGLEAEAVPDRDRLRDRQRPGRRGQRQAHGDAGRPGAAEGPGLDVGAVNRREKHGDAWAALATGGRSKSVAISGLRQGGPGTFGALFWAVHGPDHVDLLPAHAVEPLNP